MNGQHKGIPAAAIGPYGARLLHKHLMYQIPLALSRWHCAHGHTRLILVDGSTPTKTIDCIAAQHETRGNSALGILANSAQRNYFFMNHLFQISKSDLAVRSARLSHRMRSGLSVIFFNGRWAHNR
jgi:hypothetical protein